MLELPRSIRSFLDGGGDPNSFDSQTVGILQECVNLDTAIHGTDPAAWHAWIERCYFEGVDAAGRALRQMEHDLADSPELVLRLRAALPPVHLTIA